jgi:hypothetical protein
VGANKAIAGIPEAARQALDRHAWAEAFALLKESDRSGVLDGEGLEALAEASWWTAQPAENIAARERAFTAYVAAGEKRRAAIAAVWLVRDYGSKGADAIARAWLERAEKLLEGDENSAAFGYLLFIRTFIGRTEGPDEEIAIGRRIAALAERFGDRDLQAYGLMDRGHRAGENGRRRSRPGDVRSRDDRGRRREGRALDHRPRVLRDDLRVSRHR